MAEVCFTKFVIYISIIIMHKIPKSGIVVQKLPSNVLKMPQQMRPV